jgi:hypothetical protein
MGGASTNAAVEAPPANDAFLEVYVLRKQPGLIRGGATFAWLSIRPRLMPTNSYPLATELAAPSG